MNVHLITPASPKSISLALAFQGMGDLVTESDQIHPGADLHIFSNGQDQMKSLFHGLMVLDLRDEPTPTTLPWVHYADLCLVASDSMRQYLVHNEGCEPERILAISDEAAIAELLHRGLHSALPRTISEGHPAPHVEPRPAEGTQPQLTAHRLVALAARLAALEHQSDVMLRGYQVRSKIPLVGPLIAWLRRNLTSHLREPYLDPMFERQVTLNRELVATLRDLLGLVASMEGKPHEVPGERDNE